jgi:inosine-uridine nucleoside N-ribohydrolase
MIDLVYDCDITMGLPGRDVDDGLALLYLLGSPDIRLHGITSTFGNSSIEEVHPCLLTVLADLGRSDIPAYRGASRDAIDAGGSSPCGRDARADSDAARFLAETVGNNPGRVSVLATGSPTNLLGAYRLHPGFFNDVKQIVYMGGVTEPLMINGREMAELNFASDPEAAFYALYAGEPPDGTGIPEEGARRSPRPTKDYGISSIVTGNLCLQALLSGERFNGFLKESRSAGANGIATYLEEKLLPWFDWIEQVYEIPGFHAWDATAALYLTDPHLFGSKEVSLRSTLEDLQRGFLRTEETIESRSSRHAGSKYYDRRRITIPTEISDTKAYWRILFHAWQQVESAGRV